MDRDEGEDEFDYMADDIDEENEMEEYMEDEYEFYNSDSEDDVDTMSRVSDTTAVQAKRGKDVQGIPWDRLHFTREKYRETRLQHYKNYENLLQPRYGLDKLRNLVWATSKHDVYLMQTYSIMHWSPLCHRGTEVLNVAGHIIPSEKHPGSLPQGLTRVQISTMTVKENLLVAGGFQGELICKYLDRPGVSFCTKITHDENAITNAVEIYNSRSGTTQLMTSNNDYIVRVFDTQKFAVLGRFCFPWSVNHTSVSPDSKLIAVLGDNTDCMLADCQTGKHTSISPDSKLLVIVGDSVDGLLADSQSGKAIATLKGHFDYSFASAWHPDGRIFATGNQDTTCRLWDVRNLSSSLTVLKGRIGAIRSIRFSSDGRFMAMAEPADFVHIYDTKQDYNQRQEIDLFGEIAGISFSPDTEAFFVGVADTTYGSLLEFNRQHANFYLESLI